MFSREWISIWCWLGVLAGIAWLGIPAAQGQGDATEVHIQPRGQLSLGNSTTGPDLNVHAQAIRKNVELVLVPVTLTDDMGRVVVGLGQRKWLSDNGKEGCRRFLGGVTGHPEAERGWGAVLGRHPWFSRNENDGPLTQLRLSWALRLHASQPLSPGSSSARSLLRPHVSRLRSAARP